MDRNTIRIVATHKRLDCYVDALKKIHKILNGASENMFTRFSLYLEADIFPKDMFHVCYAVHFKKRSEQWKYVLCVL